MSSRSEVKLHEVKPRELDGRDTIARFNGQFKAAAFAALSILEGKEIDRVYCDYHDDFVVRHVIGSRHEYHFYQVKTKSQRNYQWSLMDLCGLYTQKGKKSSQDKDKIVDSFVGKLLLHTVNFKDSCGKVIFMTNVQFKDDVESLIKDLTEKKFDYEYTVVLVNKFNECYFKNQPGYGDDAIKVALSKLSFLPGVQYIMDEQDFEALAREQIYKFSEIDLRNVEAKKIVNNLVNLIEKKSFNKIYDISEADLDNSAGVGLSEILDILSISKGAYEALVKGGDEKALKNASILQRKLSVANADPQMIEYCCKIKLDWDTWFREKRHVIPEYDLNFLQEKLNAILQELVQKRIEFHEISDKLSQLFDSLRGKIFDGHVTKELLFGGVLSAMVRSESL